MRKPSRPDSNSSDDFILFTPKSGFNGNASFEYTLGNGNGGTDIGLVSVAVGNNINGSNGNDNLTDIVLATGEGSDTVLDFRNSSDRSR